MPLEVTATPPLSNLADVELCQTGTWHLSTGPATFTTEDFMSAVAALECPAIRRPVLKLGHGGNFGAGEPAIGYIDNMRGADAWATLVGDYAGMPGWLATPDDNGQTVLASAFPDRSIEGAWDWRCQLGHTHPFVVLAVSLLGSVLPGVGTLASLQDVGRLYGTDGVPELVAASAEQDTQRAFTANGSVVTVIAHRKDQTMPNPQPRTVAATVTSDDVRRAFYDSPIGDNWDTWIEEIQLDPLQIIYVDDDEGARFRVPVTLDESSDGIDAVSFGEPVQVVIRYEDSGAVAASSGTERIHFATRSESRPGQRPTAAAPQTPAAPAVGPTTQERSAAVAFTDEQLTTMRQQLGLPADADEAAIVAAQSEALTERADPPAAVTPPAVPDGSVVIDADALEELRIAARAGQEARAVQLRAERDGTIAAAISAGHIAPARRDHWASKWDADPEGVAASITELSKGEPIYPVTASGYAGDADEQTDAAAGDDYWFPGTPVAAGAKTEG